jgi:phage-related protein (TIGR01555 family)
MKTSIKAAVRDAVRADTRTRKSINDGTQTKGATFDSFVNLSQKLGIGADNALSGGSYGYNPITRNRTLLEWIHRGSWLGGVAVDLVADDMTRAGIDFLTEIKPGDQERISATATNLHVWEQINETIRWSRLYGGAIAVALIDGQDMRTPLDINTVGPGQFKGLLPLDRWMVDPSLEDLVTDYGPHLGLPKYYRVQANAPALRGMAIHHSRCMLRLEGIQLPYQQRLTENLWGISVLERLYDRMVAFDSASTGAAQLVYKSYLRTLSIEGLRDIVSAGGAPMNGLMTYVDVMRRYQGMEGITLLDASDKFEVQGHSAFSGLSDALNQFGQQLSGALQIPLVRLFGQSPSGMNSTGESDLRMFYDHIRQQQRKTLYSGVTLVYQMIAQSEGIKLPPNFAIDFSSLWQLEDKEKADIASSVGSTVSKAFEDGLVSQKTALQELRQSSKTTGIFTNVTEEAINLADDQVAPPGGDGEGLLLDGAGDPPSIPGMPPKIGDQNGKPAQARPDGEAGDVPDGPRRRVKLQQPPAPSRKANRADSQGAGS